MGPRQPTARSGFHLYTSTLDGKHLAAVPLRRARCVGDGEAEPVFLPDGRLAYSSQCPDRNERQLLAYDFRRHTTTPLRPYRLPLFAAPSFDFSPRDGRGVISVGDRLSNRLYWLGARRLEPIRLPFSNAGSPAWSRDGRRIAIDAVPASAGPDTPVRSNTPWSLYTIDEHAHGLRRLVSAFVDNAPSAWSPDDRWLVTRTTVRGGPTGIWLVGTKTGRLRLVVRGSSFGVPTWLDERRVLVTTGGPFAVGKQPAPGVLVLRLPALGGLAN